MTESLEKTIRKDEADKIFAGLQMVLNNCLSYTDLIDDMDKYRREYH